MWNYLQPLVTKAFVAGEVVDVGRAQTWTGVLNAIYPVSACAISLILTKLADKLGNKPVYAACLFCGAVGYAMLAMTGSKILMGASMLLIGVAWAGILAMPYSIFSRTIDARSAGAYMGIFNFTVTIPQICMGLCGGLLVALIKKIAFGAGYFQSIAQDAAAKALAESRIAAGIFLIAGLFMLLASISVHFVSDKKYND